MAAPGYAWWYLDGLSDDGHHAITLIVFVGSVFSPYYARARARGTARACDHVAFNVSVQGAASRWAMTERGAHALRRDTASLQVGASRLQVRGGVVEAEFDEVSVPWPRRLRGRVRIEPEADALSPLALDAHGRHRWSALVPRGRVTVELDAPRCAWSGSGYLDHNAGEEPLEDAFERWQWSRLTGAREVRLQYDVVRRDGSRAAWAFALDAAGRGGPAELLADAPLPATRWGLERRLRGAPSASRLVRTLEDGPFYARSQVATRLDGEPLEGVHESLSLSRFRRPWVQALLPFRMPRRG
ncbi:MAG: carotenoid 1,2-hydratase [Proteobacteria bacterium]|nr:carotenoid 1,2-hydratase [Pseudomonadota bacterium]